MAKSDPSAGGTALSPLRAFILYCLSNPSERRAAVAELLGPEEAALLLANFSAAAPSRAERSGRRRGDDD